MDTQRKTSAASIQYPEQTLSCLFLRCVSGNLEIMDFRERLVKSIQKRTSIIMSALTAKQHQNTLCKHMVPLRFIVMQFFSTLGVSTNTTPYVGIHTLIRLVSFMITHLKTKTSDICFKDDRYWKFSSFPIVGHPSALLSLCVSTCTSAAVGVKRKTGHFYHFT